MNKIAIIIIIVIVILAIIGIAGFWKTPAGGTQNKTVSLANKAGLGEYLVDGKGKTLYYFADDSPGKSNCTGPCLIIWSAFYIKNLIVNGSLKQSDFGTMKRDDGLEQITYKGWPLYYYQKDANAGDVLGQGIDSLWYVMKP